MKKSVWVTCLILTIVALITPLWPIGIILLVYLLIYSLVKGTNNSQENRLSAQIDLIARQLGIEYGSAEEKLEQIAKVATRSYTDREGGAE